MTDISAGDWVCADCSTSMPRSARFCRGCGAAAESSAVSVLPPQDQVLGEPAEIGRRVGAYAIDGAIAFAVALIGGVIVGVIASGVVASATDYNVMAGAITFASVAPNVISFAYGMFYCAAQGGKGSPGMRMLGLRLVRFDTQEQAGFGRALGRNIVLSLTGLIVVGYFSPLFDTTGRNRGWHDQASNTIMLDVRSARPARAVAPPIRTAAPRASIAVRASATVRPPTEPALAAPAPAAPAHAAPAPLRSTPAGPAVPAPTGQVPPMPTTPIDAGVISAVPGVLPQPAPLPALDEDLERTRMGAHGIAPRRSSAVRLRFDDGTEFLVADSALVGRNPAPRSGEAAGELVALDDQTRSISKTHARLELVGDQLSVIDRHSTNGTAVIVAGISTPVPAGGRAIVPSGATLAFGDRTATVEWA